MFDQVGKLGTPTPVNQPEILKKSCGFKELADEFEKTMIHLREEVFGLNQVFGIVLIPESTECCKENEIQRPVMSPIELFISEQLGMARACLNRIENYKNRCSI